MIALLLRLGLSDRIAKLVAYVALPLLLLLALWLGIRAIHHDGYKAGVSATDAKWVAAKDKLEAEAKQSATRADDKAVERLEQYEQQEQDDRKAVEDAKKDGSSPLDALFGD